MAPSLQYPLGTDSTGRDMLALMIVARRTACAWA